MQLIKRLLQALLDLFKKKPIQEKPVEAPPIASVTPRTKDIKGKRKRRLHPLLRKMIEDSLFKDGLPESFIKKDTGRMMFDVSRCLLSMEIRETDNNKGFKVGLIQSVIGEETETGDGQPWCMSFVQNCVAFVEDYLQKESGLLDSEHCMSTLRHAKDNYLLLEKPKLGCIIVWEHGNTDQGHTGIVVELRGLTELATIEGNTGDRSFRDGDGVFLRNRSRYQDGDMIVRGFIDAFATL